MSFTTISQPSTSQSSATQTFTSTSLTSTNETLNESTSTLTHTRSMQRTSTPTKMVDSRKKEDSRTNLNVETNKKFHGDSDTRKKGLVAPGGKDVAKNIEIRRMSSTEEGDKVLDSAWDSPEKEEKGRTPLEMVQNIVSR